MMRSPRHARRSGLPLLAAAICLWMLGDGIARDAARIAFADRMPQTVLWAWEEPEDLRGADSRTVGVAYLAETLLLGDALTVRPRHQPLAVAPGMAVMAVVRIETGRDFRDSAEVRQQTASALAEVSRRPDLRALQVDFDATRSERAFYSAVLRELRPRMPVGMPLSITALVSWCGDPAGWLAGLPIDEAVPMFFRLGGHARPYDDKSWIPLREPLCRASIGISTDESWPEVSATGRVYLFAPRPWSETQLAAVDEVARGERAAALRMRNSGAGDLRAMSSMTGLGARGGDGASGQAFEEPAPREEER
jgi:hypothetical protein